MVVEAASGYGKSVLGAELLDAWGVLPVWVTLEESGVSARLLAARLRAAVARAGLADTAGAIAAAGDDPVGAVDAMLAGLAKEPVALVIDDAQHADRDAARLLARIAGERPASLRLVILTRTLPPGTERLRGAGALELSAADLALAPDETLALCRSGFGLDVSPEAARRLRETTGGWTAAAVLAASRARRTTGSLAEVTRVGGSPPDAVGSILDDVVLGLGIAPALAAQIARLPLLDAELVGELTGDEHFFARALAAGLPLAPARGGWWELPGPVREHLARGGPPEPERLRFAAELYARRGELGTALQMLMGLGGVESAARLLSEAPASDVEALDVLELLAIIARIPDPVLDAHPPAMLHVAHSCHLANLLSPRARLLERLDAVVSADADAVLRRAVDAELATELVLDGNQADAAAQLARRVLAEATPAEQHTRARAFGVVARASWWQRDPDGRRPVEHLREAAGYFDQAWEILLSLGQRSAAANLAAFRAMWSEFDRGRAQAAVEILNQGLALAVDRPRRLAIVLNYRAEALTELGRFDEAEVDLDEVARLAGELGDPGFLIAYTHWNRMTIASLRGDAERALHEAQETEAHRADWWEHGSADFLGEAADALDRVGHAALAWEYLERARADPGDADRILAMAECALLARHGDPERAERCLLDAPRHGIVPREYWRVTLLRAFAAFRRGDDAAGALAARAFAQAGRLGQPLLPWVRERELTESLLALAVATGQPAARALEASALPVTLAVLGRFSLTRGGREIPLAAGQGPQLLKLIAVSGGRLLAEQAIEALWPEVDPSAGRNRLRTVLNRLRDAAPGVVDREGELLTLGAEVRLDLSQFHDEARRAGALRSGDPDAAVAVARSAIARYRGPLLPHDPYEPWAQEPRDGAQRTMLDLLDLCAAAATARGDLDEARRIVERTIELAPYDDDRYLKVATILHAEGRKGAALSVLRRARAALAQLGIDPPAELAALEAQIAAAGTARLTAVSGR